MALRLEPAKGCPAQRTSSFLLSTNSCDLYCFLFFESSPLSSFAACFLPFQSLAILEFPALEGWLATLDVGPVITTRVHLNIFKTCVLTIFSACTIVYRYRQLDCQPHPGGWHLILVFSMVLSPCIKGLWMRVVVVTLLNLLDVVGYQYLKGTTHQVVATLSIMRNQLPWAQEVHVQACPHIQSQWSKDHLHAHHWSGTCQSPGHQYSSGLVLVSGFPEAWDTESSCPWFFSESVIEISTLRTQMLSHLPPQLPSLHASRASRHPWAQWYKGGVLEQPVHM